MAAPRTIYFFLSLLFPLNILYPLHISHITSVLYSTSAHYRVAISREQSKWIRLVFQDRLDPLRVRKARRFFQRCPTPPSLLRQQRPTTRPVPLRQVNLSCLTPLQTEPYWPISLRHIAWALSTRTRLSSLSV